MWDCTLEMLAEVAVVSCPQEQLVTGQQNGMNYLTFGPGGMTPSVPSNLIESAVLKWAEITNVMWPSDNTFDANLAWYYFANLIRASTIAIGCSSVACGIRTSVACVFSQPNVQPGTLVYTAGNPCQNDGQCTRFNPGYCENGLCVNAARPATTTTATVAPTTSRRRSTDCPSTAFTAAFRETALGTHNNFRSLVARGLARNGEYSNENAPPASRMDLLEYDCGAEQLALNHVKSCDRRLSPPASRPGHKENIHILETTATDALGALQNILWGANKYVACATQMCNGFYFTSCMYREP
uniref:SCP domain-containing protein n=1 Tax=Angiostrongylus cantonensis TaxID=6313 RepID=A0A0K0DPX3_ANGCA